MIEKQFKSSFACIVFVLTAVYSYAGATFTEKPVASTKGEGVVLSFAVSESTDVEVTILDRDGGIVRHLAAGVLGGKNPPPAPLIRGLNQSVAWDGKNDVGKAVANGPFKARVRLGMKAELDGFVGESKYWIGDLQGMATDTKGRLYVYSSSVMVKRGYIPFLQIFDRDGNYIRTIMPMPANLPKEKLQAFKKTKPKDKVTPRSVDEHFIPRNYYGTWPEFYPPPMGELVSTVNSKGIITLHNGRATGLARITDKGEAVGDSFWKKAWDGKTVYWRDVVGARCIVPSADGDHLYLSGYYGKKKKYNKKWPHGRIYRMENTPEGRFEKWADLTGGEKPPAAGWSVFDGEGNLLVADTANNRIVVLNASGKQIKAFKSETRLSDKHTSGPSWIGCDTRNGNIYVMHSRKTGYHQVDRQLIKYGPWKTGMNELTRHNLGKSDYSMNVTMDATADPVVVWTAFRSGGKGSPPMQLLRIEDRGGEFKLTGDLMDMNKDPFGVKPRMAVHPETDVVICNDGAAKCQGYNGLTGEKIDLPTEYAVDMDVGLDNNWYLQTGEKYSGPIARYSKDLKPLPVEDGDKKDSNVLGAVYGRMGAGFCTVGLAADASGRVYSQQMYDWQKYCVAVFGPDGKPEDPGRLKDMPGMKKNERFDSAILGPIETTQSDIELDWQGNIYIGVAAKPLDYTPVPGFEHDKAYESCVGSVVKFKPEGGSIRNLGQEKTKPAGKDGLVLHQGKRPHVKMYQDQRGGRYRFMENGIAVYPELGSVGGKFGDFCMCRQPMFDVDRWGRLFLPNAITCSVRIVDNAGNLIQQFGHYGNIDSRGPGEDSMIKTPDVPLGWPQAVGASYKAVYVSDVLNRRIVRMKTVYAAEETVDVN